MLLSSLLFVALIVIGVAMIVRALRGPRSTSATAPSPAALDVLESRYARGEIDRDEFEERRSTLAG